jgi:MFS family permease
LNLPAFQTAFGLSTASTAEKANLSSNIVSTFQAGAFFGAIGAFFLTERLGRKRTLLTSALIFMVGAILQMLGRLDCLYAGRALTGMGIGVSTAVVPVYVSECAPAAVRGRLVGMFEVMLQIALVFGFWVNYGVNQNFSGTDPTQWRIPVAIQFIPAGLLILCMLPMIESPRWLISKGKREAAVKALSWVRNLPADHPYVVRELAMIETAVEQELVGTHGGSNWKRVVKEASSQKGIRNRILLAMALMVLQNFTG